MSVQDFLESKLASIGHGPFLFTGSGFSRRYIGLEDWAGVLKRFTEPLPKPYNYYFSNAKGDLPTTATEMVNDFNDYWWSADEVSAERDCYEMEVISPDSPLKISISNHITNISSKKIDDVENFKDELEELRKVNIDGIITTNWDLFVEEALFPEYDVFVGQESLLVSPPQNLGEIYKIHGCCTKPNSLVLTKEDYDRYLENNPYLAAKLITIFVENPVIFIGYSLTDSNIKALLTSIVKGIGPEHIDKISQNLIFVQRVKAGREYGVKESIISLEDADISVTTVVTDDYKEIYKALQLYQHKIPTKILRHLKQQFYEFVSEVEPSDKLCVVDYEELDDTSNVEFVVGLGVKAKVERQIEAERVESAKIYSLVKPVNVFKDIIGVDGNFDPHMILDTVIPEFSGKYIPVFKYLREVGIDSAEKYNESEYDLFILRDFKMSNFQTKQAKERYKRSCSGKNVSEIVEEFDDDVAVTLIPCINWKSIDTKDLKGFLVKNVDKFDADNSRYATYYRKLVCIYDAMTNGWY